jgi:hypothetical protein
VIAINTARLFMTTWLVASLNTAKQVEQISRKRSGIETTYRLIRQARGVTTIRDPVVRFAFMLVAAVLENPWLVLRWTVIARAGRARVTFLCFAIGSGKSEKSSWSGGGKSR